MKNAIVFGASGFLGKEIERFLINTGYNVISTYHSHIPENKNYPDKLAYIRCDVSDPEDVASVFVFTRDTFGVPDIVINASGIALQQALLSDINPKDIADVIQTDLLGALYISREAAREMHTSHSGLIIHISSMWGSLGASCEVPYSAAKGGLNTMVKALAKEIAPDGIRVNAIAPGLLLSPMNAHLSKEDLEAFKGETPLNCFITPEDICCSIRYLIESPHITGQILAVDGGMAI